MDETVGRSGCGYDEALGFELKHAFLMSYMRSLEGRLNGILDELPRAYTKDLYDQNCDLVYQHFYEAYMGQGKSLYAVN